MVVLESFREGTPVIARRLGPFPEILEQSEGGVLFETAEQLRTGIASMLDPEARDRMGANALSAFRSRWSERTAIDGYLGMIGQLAHERGRSDIEAKMTLAPV
jgi:glycosyltransferase involved in cell wall biosynthesis